MYLFIIELAHHERKVKELEIKKEEEEKKKIEKIMIEKKREEKKKRKDIFLRRLVNIWDSNPSSASVPGSRADVFKYFLIFFQRHC